MGSAAAGARAQANLRVSDSVYANVFYAGCVKATVITIRAMCLGTTQMGTRAR